MSFENNCSWQYQQPAPTVRRLQLAFPRLTIKQFVEIRGLLHGEIYPLNYASVKSVYSDRLPRRIQIMYALNDVIEGYGIKYIDCKEGRLMYVNMGDSYATTFLTHQFIPGESERIFISSLADEIERLEKKGKKSR